MEFDALVKSRRADNSDFVTYVGFEEDSALS
jgi:hypothetical protein